MIEKLKSLRWGYGLMALATASVGVLVLIFNVNMMAGLAIAIGVVTVLGAAVLAVNAITNRERSVKFFAKCALAASMLVAGIVMFCLRESVVDTIISVLGLLLVLDGAFKVYENATRGYEPTSLWWIVTAVAVLLIAGGYVTVRWAYADFAVFLLGAAMLVDAAANLIALFRSRSEP